MFISYVGNDSFSRLDEKDKQHNIMVFIGNGFDISVLSKYRQDKLVSSYSKFFDYLCYKDFNEKNVLYKKCLRINRKVKRIGAILNLPLEN